MKCLSPQYKPMKNKSMKNIVLVAKREFLTQVKKKSFIILTLFTPLLLVVFGGVVSFIFQANKAENNIKVIDKSGIFEHKLKSDENVAYTFMPKSNENHLKNALKSDEEADEILIIPEISNIHQLNKVELLTNKNIGYEVRHKIIQDLTDIVKSKKILDLGVTPLQIQDLEQKVLLNVTNISGQNEDDMLIGVKTGISGFLMYVVFMFIFMYGVRVMRSVLEEKSTRVVEIIISSVKPLDLMMGKILGVTGVALVQFFAWIMMVVGLFQFLDTSENNMLLNYGEAIQNIFSTMKEIDFGLILFVFVVYFLLGYLFYSAMFAAIGSAVDSETETQQFTMFAIIPLALGFYGSMSIMNNPDGAMSFWLSMIPFTSPIAMLARIPFGVSTWELLLSISILFLSVLGMIFIASKIYRMGILMYGSKVSYKDLWKWIKNS